MLRGSHQLASDKMNDKHFKKENCNTFLKTGCIQEKKIILFYKEDYKILWSATLYFSNKICTLDMELKYYAGLISTKTQFLSVGQTNKSTPKLQLWQLNCIIQKESMITLMEKTPLVRMHVYAKWIHQQRQTSKYI